MGKLENNCIYDEISVERTSNHNKNAKKNHKNKKILERKKANSKLNLFISLVIFIVMVILALFIIFNKGKFGNYSLIYVNDSIHTAELECDSYFLSTLDSEATGVTLTIDGIEKTEGYTLSSSNENVAKIENNMVVVGDSEGTATITAYFEEYDMNISTDIVAYIPINTITATVRSSSIKVGAETELTISIVPKKGTDDYITYSSSDESVATVDEEGVIKGISKGTAIITIEDELTGASATKTITVK